MMIDYLGPIKISELLKHGHLIFQAQTNTFYFKNTPKEDKSINKMLPASSMTEL